MRVHLATFASGDASLSWQGTFERLADLDSVGDHVRCADPTVADAILFVDAHALPFSEYARAIRRDSRVRLFRRKVFVYDQRDQPLVTLPGLYVSASARWASRYGSLSSAPYVRLPSQELAGSGKPARQEADLLFSFVGRRTHPIRDRTLAIRRDRALIMEPGSDDIGRLEYEKLILRSKFVLCPRGYGPSSYRIFEALALGRVPVVISDEWLPPPRIDWRECSVRVPERFLEGVGEIVEAREAEWPSLSAAAKATFATHFAPDRMWHYLITTVSGLQASRRSSLEMPWWLRRRALHRHFARLAGRPQPGDV